MVAQHGEGGEGVGAAEQRVASLAREQIGDVSPPRAALLAHEERCDAAVTERDDERHLEDGAGAARRGEQRACSGLGLGLGFGLGLGLGLRLELGLGLPSGLRLGLGLGLGPGLGLGLGLRLGLGLGACPRWVRTSWRARGRNRG
eukprot:scaffold41220_cov71-Phaeocystis_antarctica.AAC.6